MRIDDGSRTPLMQRGDGVGENAKVILVANRHAGNNGGLSVKNDSLLSLPAYDSIHPSTHVSL